MRTVVISDVHGAFDKLEECLFEAGIINAKGTRMTDPFNRCEVISIGDLANCVEEDIEGDIKCLKKVGDWIDFMLMGNHEIPYYDLGNRFSGFHRNDRVFEELQRIDYEGRLRVGALRKGALITHAGWTGTLHTFISTPQEALQALTEALQSDGWSHRYFSQIGRKRGGIFPHGGILWEDFNDLKSPFPQIVGHTAGRTIKAAENVLCIDTGGGKYGKPTAVSLY
jgi:hypothetical protein